MNRCKIRDCEAVVSSKGWCQKHYMRWFRHGDPLAGATYYANPEDSFVARTEPLAWSGCIVWTGTLLAGGYGQISVDGGQELAHRYAYERAHGPIQDGAQIDHVCHERSCVNVEHLRPATRSQNQQNRSGPEKGRGLPRGVYRVGTRYRTQVRHGGRAYYLGTFETVAEADRTVRTKRAELFGAYAGRG